MLIPTLFLSDLTVQTANGTDYKETDKWNLYDLMDWCHQPEQLKHSVSVHQACQHEGRLPQDHFHHMEHLCAQATRFNVCGTLHSKAYATVLLLTNTEERVHQSFGRVILL